MFRAIFFIFFIFLSFYQSTLGEPLCFGKLFSIKKGHKGVIKESFYLTTSTVIVLPSSSIDITSLITSGCIVFGPPTVSLKEKEQLIFMAFNHNPVMIETVQREGEFVSIAMDAMGCAKKPEVFYDVLAENFDEVFQEKEYGLAYAIRANRVLSRQKICEQNGVRRFLTAMDTQYSKEYPDFPRLPPEVIRQNRAELQKIAEEYNQRFSPEKAGKK